VAATNYLAVTIKFRQTTAAATAATRKRWPKRNKSKKANVFDGLSPVEKKQRKQLPYRFDPPLTPTISSNELLLLLLLLRHLQLPVTPLRFPPFPRFFYFLSSVLTLSVRFPFGNCLDFN